ncbi:MAG TPA: hypothetical protein VMW27_31000 [Thermoanaerobaculia bacterium]|nr:hypothetical protein [Thermoanaerobaculia bacterium]
MIQSPAESFSGELSGELRTVHAGLSGTDLRFRELASADPELLDRRTFRSLDRWSSLLTYKRQPWPTFISRAESAGIETMSVGISRLIRSIPERVFQNDAARVAQVYGIAENVARFLLQPPNGIDGLLSRGDFVRGRSGFKCVEFNMSSSLGGWETGPLAGMLQQIPPIARFLRETGLEVRYKDTLRITLVHILRRAVEAGLADDGEIHTTFTAREALPLSYPEAIAFLDREYQAALAEVDPALRGTLGFCNYTALSERDGALYAQNRRIRCVIERHVYASERITARLAKLGRIHLYNGPAARIMSDKTNIAILSAHEESPLFSAEERELIRKHVPWTRPAVPGPTTFRGETVPMDRMLLARREEMVLKKVRSLGGYDVVLGIFSTPNEWEAAVGSAFSQGDWLAQEYIESLPYLFQAGSYGCSPHDVVWGPFVSGSTYAGTILRVQPKSLQGIVNLSQGATEGILLEVDE